MNTKTNFSPRAIRGCIAFVLFAVFTVPTHARETESLNGIAQFVRSFIQSELKRNKINNAKVEIRSLDSRLKLSKCTTLLKPNLNNANHLIGKLMVAVNCKEPKPWTVHVPVEVTVYIKVLAASRPLPKGHIIVKNDLVPTVMKLSQNNNVYFVKLDNLIGKEVKRTISAGKVIKPRFVAAARIVRRGENVTIIAVTESIQVRMKGKALTDGAQGQVIRVRNLKTKRVVQGVVTKPGFVKVRM